MSRPRVGLALAGGGPLGAIYEIGALCAIEESLTGIELTRLAHYVGVSSGGFIAAGLANGITPSALCRAFIHSSFKGGPPDPEADLFDPASLMVPAYDEFARRLFRLPGLVASAGLGLAFRRETLLQLLERMGPGLPAGLLSGRAIHQQLAKIFSRAGRSNDFRQLGSRLTIVATNLDTGEAAPFGQPGFDHVPISLAVQASAALPGLFPPVEIDDQYYVDGALKKTMHASVALDQGVELMLCINPLVPFDATPADGTPTNLTTRRRNVDPDERMPRVVDGGLPAVMSQTFRSLIHSRLVLGMKHYEHSYPNSDILLIEPDHRDLALHRANLFSYRDRRAMAELAYQRTRDFLRHAPPSLTSKLARHGIGRNMAVLMDADRSLLEPVVPKAALASATARLRASMSQLRAGLDQLDYLTAKRG